MKTPLIRILALALAAAFFLVRATAAEPAARPSVDLSGQWTFTVETPNGPATPTFVFTQKGEELSGTYTGYFGTAPLAGTVRGNQVKFTVKAQADGQEVALEYTGEATADSIQGRVAFGGFGESTFTGRRTK